MLEFGGTFEQPKHGNVSQVLANGPSQLQATLKVTPDDPLRFAVASFSTLDEVHGVSLALASVQGPPSKVSYLGLQKVLGAGATNLQTLPFPGNTSLVACSKGLVAERLAARLSEGERSLGRALATWLIPRHADEIERAVEHGNVVVWVQLQDNENERRAYRTLLDAGCRSVGVHDLVRA